MIGKWPKEHDKCIVCGTNKKKHLAKGMCDRCYGKEYREINSEKVKEKNRKYQKENPEKGRKRTAKYRKNNLEKVRERDRIWKKMNRSKTRTYESNRLHNNAHFKLKKRISNLVNCYLKRRLSSKEGKSTFTFLPYTVEELKQHLEKQFEPWMNWDNWGNRKNCWNIDHKIPSSSFNYKNVEDKGFQKCWALRNLRPMNAIENFKKYNKIIEKE